MRRSIPSKKPCSKLRLPNPKRAVFTTIFCFVLMALFWFSRSLTEAHSPEAGQPATLYANQNQDDLRQVMATAILDAKQSVLLMIYTLTDTKIINCLRQKSEEGIDVSVICDAKACPLIKRKLGQKVHVVKRHADGIMHQKILVIDDLKVWIGSANMTPPSLKLHGNLIAGMHSGSLAKVIKEKARNMHASKSSYALPYKKFQIGGQKVELCFFPDDTTGVERLTKLIRAAKKSIKVAMFTWTHTHLADEVVAANKRGIQTEIIIDNHSGQGVSSKVVKLLRDGGIPVRLSLGVDLLHHKFLYIDGKTLVNGSANWTKAAFTKNDDCFIILHDLTTQQQKSLNNLWDVILADSK